MEAGQKRKIANVRPDCFEIHPKLETIALSTNLAKTGLVEMGNLKQPVGAKDAKCGSDGYGGWNDIKIGNSLIQDHGEDYSWLLIPTRDQYRDILNGYYDWSSTAAALARRTATRTLELLHGSAALDMVVRATVMAWGRISSRLEGQEPKPAKVPYSPASVRHYAANVTRLFDVAHEGGARAAWFLQPLVGVGNKPPAAFRERDYYVFRMREIERRRKFYAEARLEQRRLSRVYDVPSTACIADLSDVFDGNPGTVFEDFGHLFDNGNAIVAGRIAEEFDRCGIVRRVTPSVATKPHAVRNAVSNTVQVTHLGDGAPPWRQ